MKNVFVLFLATFLFGSLAQANILRDIEEAFFNHRVKSSRVACERKYSAEQVAKIDRILSNTDSSQINILFGSRTNPEKWYTVHNKAGLSLACNDFNKTAEASRLGKVARGIGHSVFFCGYWVYNCNMVSERNGNDDTTTKGNAGGSDNGGSDNGAGPGDGDNGAGPGDGDDGAGPGDGDDGAGPGDGDDGAGPGDGDDGAGPGDGDDGAGPGDGDDGAGPGDGDDGGGPSLPDNF